MKKYLLVFSLLASPVSNAFKSLPSTNSINSETLVVCNSYYNEFETSSSCGKYDLNFAKNAAKQLASNSNHSACANNSSEPKCSSLIASTGVAYFTVIDVTNNDVTKMKVDITSNSNATNPQSFFASWASPSQDDLTLAENLNELDVIYLTLIKRASFEEKAGLFVNKLGESWASLAQLANLNTGDFSTIGNCKTALSYIYGDRTDATSKRCDALINSWIDVQAKELNSGIFTDFFYKRNSIKTTVTLEYETYEVIKKDTQIRLNFKFSDGSLIVLVITDNGPGSNPGVEVDTISSRDSEGTVLAKKLVELGYTPDSADVGYVSNAEAQAWARKINCDPHINSAINQKIKIVIKERDEDGKPVKVEFRIVDQTALTGNVYECN